MLMHGAAILDFEVGVGEVLPTFRAGNPTSGAFRLKFLTGNSEIPTSEFKENVPLAHKRGRLMGNGVH